MAYEDYVRTNTSPIPAGYTLRDFDLKSIPAELLPGTPNQFVKDLFAFDPSKQIYDTQPDTSGIKPIGESFRGFNSLQLSMARMAYLYDGQILDTQEKVRAWSPRYEQIFGKFDENYLAGQIFSGATLGLIGAGFISSAGVFGGTPSAGAEVIPTVVPSAVEDIGWFAGEGLVFNAGEPIATGFALPSVIDEGMALEAASGAGQGAWIEPGVTGGIYDSIKSGLDTSAKAAGIYRLGSGLFSKPPASTSDSTLFNLYGDTSETSVLGGEGGSVPTGEGFQGSSAGWFGGSSWLPLAAIGITMLAAIVLSSRKRKAR